MKFNLIHKYPILGSPLYSPLALVIVGGLISSLLLLRILTPVLYKLFVSNAQLALINI